MFLADMYTYVWVYIMWYNQKYWDSKSFERLTGYKKNETNSIDINECSGNDSS